MRKNTITQTKAVDLKHFLFLSFEIQIAANAAVGTLIVAKSHKFPCMTLYQSSAVKCHSRH
jgi:hypothetical protein